MSKPKPPPRKPNADATKHPGGQPTAWTPDVQKQICDALRIGADKRNAAESAGIAYRTFADWMQRGEGTHPERSQDKIYVQFVRAVKDAEAKCAVSMSSKVFTAAGESWQAAMTWLERRFPEEWGRKDRIEHSGDAAKPVVVQIEYVTPTHTVGGDADATA